MRGPRGYGYAIDIYKEEAYEKIFIAEPIVLTWKEAPIGVHCYDQANPTLFLTEREWSDLKQSLDNPMRMHGIHVSQLTIETSLKEVREHLATVKGYADRLMRIVENTPRYE